MVRVTQINILRSTLKLALNTQATQEWLRPKLGCVQMSPPLSGTHKVISKQCTPVLVTCYPKCLQWYTHNTWMQQVEFLNQMQPMQIQGLRKAVGEKRHAEGHNWYFSHPPGLFLGYSRYIHSTSTYTGTSNEKNIYKIALMSSLVYFQKNTTSLLWTVVKSRHPAIQQQYKGPNSTLPASKKKASVAQMAF